MHNRCKNNHVIAKKKNKTGAFVQSKIELKKRKRQSVQAENVVKRRRDDTADVPIGAFVTIQVDYRDVTHPRCILGVVFDVSKSNAGGIQVVMEHGVIVSGRGIYFFPNDRYKVLPKDSVQTDGIIRLRDTVTSGRFCRETHPKVTIRRAHMLLYGDVRGGRRNCKCKKGCSGNCGCLKANVACTSGCCCNGSCSNPHNNE